VEIIDESEEQWGALISFYTYFAHRPV